jgi:hypothetical protein
MAFFFAGIDTSSWFAAAERAPKLIGGIQISPPLRSFI